MTFSEERSFVPDLPSSAPPLPEREKTPWIAAACALIVPLIPTPAVLPGHCGVMDRPRGCWAISVLRSLSPDSFSRAGTQPNGLAIRAR